MGLGGWKSGGPNGYNPNQAGRLVEEAADAVVVLDPHTQLAAAVVGAVVDRHIEGEGNRLPVVAVRSSVIERYC